MSDDLVRKIRPKETKVIKVNDIEVIGRVRQDFGDLEGLKQSIRENGLIHNVTVKEKEDGGYLLLAGERRLRAVKELGWTEVMANIYPSTISELDEKAIELYENLDRKDFTFDEEVLLKRRLHNLMISIYGLKEGGNMSWRGWSLRDTASLLGESPATVSQDLKLAEAIEAIPELKESKNKKEAMKKLGKIEEELILQELRERVQSDGLSDKKKDALIEAYILKDAIEGMKELPSGSTDIIEIDPPYGINLKKQKKGSETNAELTAYNEVNLKDYASFLTAVLEEAYRVAGKDSWTLLWFAQSNWKLILEVIEKTEFKPVSIPAIWVKRTGQSQHPDVNLSNSYEMFLPLRKGNAVLNKPGRSNVFDYLPVNPESKIHPTERPIEMMMDILYTFGTEGSRVLIPFLGSGNTLLAASNLNMTAFGYDLASEYKDAFILRVMKGTIGDFTSYRKKEE